MSSSSRKPGWTGVRLVCVFAVVTVAASVRLLAPIQAAVPHDGSVTIQAWTCPPEVAGDSLDPGILGETCVTAATGLTFTLTFAGDGTELVRSTDYPVSGSGAVSWQPPFQSAITVRLNDPPAGTHSAAFCDRGQGPEPVLLANGATLLQDEVVLAAGIDCDWYVIPEPTPPTVASPSSAPMVEPTVTATTAVTAVSPVPNAQLSPAAIVQPLQIRALVGPPGSLATAARGINAAGTIVGVSYGSALGGAGDGAVKWTQNGRVVETLSPLPGTSTCEALRINDRDDIVGTCGADYDHRIAVLWVNGTPQSLGALETGTESYPTAINNSGQIVGVATTSPDRSIYDGHAFLWDDGVMIDLGSLDGTGLSVPNDISDDGVIVGRSGTAAVAWDADHRIIDLGFRGEATSVTSSGKVLVNDYHDGRAYLLDGPRNGAQRIDLGDLGGEYGRTVRINESGVVVGFTYDSAGGRGTPSATVWRNGRPEPLVALLGEDDQTGWVLETASDINAHGLIVGTGSYNETFQGFLIYAHSEDLSFPPNRPPTPVVAEPATRTPTTGESPTAVATAVYESPLFGYVVVYGSVWKISEEWSDNGIDHVRFSDGISSIDFDGFATNLSAQQCLDDEFNYFQTGNGYADAKLIRDANGDDLSGDLGGGRFGVYAFVFSQGGSAPVEYAAYVECLPIVQGVSMLRIVQFVNFDRYNEEVKARTTLLGGLTLNGAPGPAPSKKSSAAISGSGPATATFAKGSLTAITVDREGKPVGGVCYSIVDSHGNDLGRSCDEDGDGTVILTGIPVDSYSVTQISVPAGHDLDHSVASVELPAGGSERVEFVSPESTPPTPVPSPTATATPKPKVELPREFAFQGEYYLRDQVMPVTPENLFEVTAYKNFIVYGRTQQGPYEALYISTSKRPQDGMIRYLPEHLDQPDVPCPAEDARRSISSPWTLADGSIYVFAGYEVDVPSPALSVLGGNVYFQTGSATPLQTIYVKTDTGYERWLLLRSSDDNAVDQVSPGLSFGGQALTFRKAVNHPAGLGQVVRVGCVGPFKVMAALGEEEAPFRTLYIEVGDLELEFTAAKPST